MDEYEPSADLIESFEPRNADERELIRAWLVDNYRCWKLQQAYCYEQPARPHLAVGLAIALWLWFGLGFLLGAVTWR